MDPAFSRTINGIPHRAKWAPHNAVADYPRDAAHAAAAQVLDAQTRDWASRSISPTAATPRPGTPVPGAFHDLVAAPNGPSLLSSAHGRIAKMLLAYPELPGDQSYRQNLYATFIASFPHVSDSPARPLRRSHRAEDHRLNLGARMPPLRVWAEQWHCRRQRPI